MKRVFLLIALTSLLQGCRSTPTAVDRAITPIGRWSIPMVSSDTEYCGIELLEDGRARSINLITLHYEEWKQRGDTLVLSGRSIVNDAEQSFADTMKILTLTRSKMVLQQQGFKWEMNRLQN